MAEALLGYDTKAEEQKRLHIKIRGAVQGVGFRPFVYRLACELGLTGWVRNSGAGVVIEAEGPKRRLDNFLLRIRNERPAHAVIRSEESVSLEKAGYRHFAINASDLTEEKTTLILPDIATCPDCLQEMFDPHDRRYLYPFINCTCCGPRYSIIEVLPYDRKHTCMKKFNMCEDCRNEYEDPLCRRFHAQPIACPRCGPHMELWDSDGRCIAGRNEAMRIAVQAIRQGKIVAIKGIGGFQLMADAGNDDVISNLRKRKQRKQKPFAMMFPSLESIKQLCCVSRTERQLLESSQAPIVLLKRREDSGGRINISPCVAPGNPYYGIMLPYTPMHHILMKEFGAPVVATSGNLSDEPICIDEKEAFDRLHTVADLFLVHNRPVVRYVDDSVVRVMRDRAMILRCARGYAPLPIAWPETMPVILGLGAHLKNTIALSVQKNIFISQHIGELESKLSFDAFKKTVSSFKRLYESAPAVVACDRHPDYLSTVFAKKAAVPIVSVQHHHAHLAACMAENGVFSKALGVVWDGAGLGVDGTIWGGEFLLSTLSEFVRIGHFRTFRLPGGAAAIKEPRRTAIGLLYEVFGQEAFNLNDLPCLKAFTANELHVIRKMLVRGLNAPFTTSVGRLFDGVASLMGLHQRISFEGQAAMALEAAVDGSTSDLSYSFEIFEEENEQSPLYVIDWSIMIKEILKDLKAGVSCAIIARKFHNSLVEIVVAVARRVREEKVVLSGGCFQNKFLTEAVVQRLCKEGFNPYWHRRVPPNDEGISLGQVVVASRRIKDLRSTNGNK
ncbi:MAG: carbamoyltransferase HypF [Deltaproteobacteria bacterium]|nr:carbamoyltransferase HypF [Deltaproteobacteria bacterium]